MKQIPNLFVKGSTKDSISNITDALSHYRGKSGKTVPATNVLIQEMKADGSFKKMIKELEGTIKSKITKEKINKKETISAAPGSRRGVRCGCLGSYNLNISYSFVPKIGDNKFDIYFSGSDLWDFEPSDQKNWFQNLVEEKIPGMLAGDGVPFNITYSFEYSMCIKYS